MKRWQEGSRRKRRQSRREVERVGRVLNLKVKPPPLLPNPCAEREGCLASSSHSTDLNGSRAPPASGWLLLLVLKH
ncbi:hypothetical protein M0802_007358 [Mischocyttarus mexicanus]|nr:hypothetical protein M0802_007358 [Mischocyttarus mexicanus]